MPQDHVRAKDLAAILGLGQEALLDLASRSRVRPLVRRSQGSLVFRWSEVQARMDLDGAARLRASIRERAFTIPASKWVVAGWPQLRTEWHRTKNGELTPWHVTRGSARRVWWKCPKGPDHEWRAAPGNRTSRRPTGCPFCYNRRVSVTNSLSSLRPDVARLWHPTKNRKKTPRHVTAISNDYYWWKCPAGPDHVFRNRIRALTKEGRRCPFCRERRVSTTGSLAVRAPRLASEWHPKRNRSLGPEDVTRSSTLRVWWKCARGPDHVWVAAVNSRARPPHTGCPFCEGMKPSITTALATVAPLVAREWHPTRNGELRPRDLVAGSARSVWWKCPRGADHEWRASPGERTSKGTGCPFCAGRRPSSSTSLAAKVAVLAAQWHPTKNGALRPDDVTPGSAKRVWWKCPEGPDHEWRATPAYRVHRLRRGHVDCRFCLGREVSVTNCLATLHPAIARLWHPARNGKLGPNDVTTGTPRRVWWKCPASGHVWRRTVMRMTRFSAACPKCGSGP